MIIITCSNSYIRVSQSVKENVGHLKLNTYMQDIVL